MKRKGFWISAGLLVVPVVIFYILSAGVQNYKKLPVLGDKQLSAAGDTIYYQVPSFHAWDQSGKDVSKATFNERVYIANFFYVGCQADCATMNRRLSQVYEKYVEFTEVQFLSFALDSENTTVPALFAYAKKYNADAEIWHFALGNKDTMQALEDGFLAPLPVTQRTLKNGHCPQLVLVDKQNRIRGIYDSDSEAAVEQLKDDLKVLLYEYHQPGT